MALNILLLLAVRAVGEAAGQAAVVVVLAAIAQKVDLY